MISTPNRYKLNIFKKMEKTTHLGIDLKLVMQNEPLLKAGKCYNGILTRDGEYHYRFEEAIRKGRKPHNPKLFDGTYVTLIRMSNGRCQFFLKGFDPQEVDRETVPFLIRDEISNALKIID